MDTAYHYWTFNLSPFLFQVKNLNFEWVTTWWGLLSLIVFFSGGFFLSAKVTHLKIREAVQTTLFYALIIFVILFGLNKFQINWGLRWYSLMYLIGFMATYFTCLYWIKKRMLMLTEPMLTNFLFFTIMGSLLGARLAYVFVYNWDKYKYQPLSIFATWEGGLSFHGGIVGGLLVSYIMCKKYKLNILHIADKMVRVIPLGIAFGRIGNFMNGELWGRPISSHVPWAIIFPGGGQLPRHPSQLYQSLGEGWLLLVTLFVLSRFRQREGSMLSYFIIFYSLYRFVVEYFREADSQINYFYLNHFSWATAEAYPGTHWTQMMTMGQLLCFAFFVCGIALYFFTRKNKFELQSQKVNQ